MLSKWPDDASGAEAWAGGAILAILGVYRDEMPHDAVAALQTLADRLGHPLAPLPARDDAVEEARDAVVNTAVSFFALLDTMSLMEAVRRKEWVDFGACVAALRREKGGA